MDVQKIKFNKIALSTNEQIEILSKRGLIIGDTETVFRHLSTVSYYRLSGYFKPFQINEEHTFRPDVTFDRIWQIYVFDRELRLLLSDALERFEIALRTALSDVMSIKYGNLWYLSKKPFCDAWSLSKKHNGLSPHEYFINEVNDICRNRKEEFIYHYFEKYNDPKHPPSWMLMESLSFGKITSLFRNLSYLQDKKLISNVFGYHPRVIESTLEPLRYTRNLCAHHSRIWNRWFVYAPKHINAFGTLLSKPHSFHQQAFIINKLNESISPDSEWLQRLYQLFDKYSAFVPFHLMGFQHDWKNDLFWES